MQTALKRVDGSPRAQIDVYVMELCPLKGVRQIQEDGKSVSLGVWSGWQFEQEQTAAEQAAQATRQQRAAEYEQRRQQRIQRHRTQNLTQLAERATLGDLVAADEFDENKRFAVMKYTVRCCVFCAHPLRWSFLGVHCVPRSQEGEQCWNGPKRSADVVVSCGPENRLVSVIENGKVGPRPKRPSSRASCEAEPGLGYVRAVPLRVRV